MTGKMAQSMSSCPLCGSADLRDVVQLDEVPVLCNQLWPSTELARAAPTCDIDLVLCDACGLFSNRTFRDELVSYAPGYENALHFSPSYRSFAEALCKDLVERHDLAGRDVVEIGCGDGHFLDLMVKSGVHAATGFDPSMAGTPSIFAETEGVEIVPESIGSHQLDRPFDALICRHVLEHLPDPLGTLRNIRAAVGNRHCPAYFEVPNAHWMVENGSVWDVIYEHATYWTKPSLATLFHRAGFAPTRIRAGYGEQFLMIEAVPTRPLRDWLASPAEIKEVQQAALKFASMSSSLLTTWRQRLSHLGRQGRRAAVWGAGSKGITFANVADRTGRCLIALVDVNVRKHGLFAPIVALPVVAPERLVGMELDLVIISNELYATEIARMIGEIGLVLEIYLIKS